MHRVRVIRSMVAPKWQLPARALAPSRLVLGHRSVPPISPHQQLRLMTTTLGGAALGTASWAAVMVPFVLIARSLRRRQINKKLQNTLDEVRQLQDQEKRRQVFFDVARRHARNNGARVDLKDTFNREIKDIDELVAKLEEGTSACNLETIGPHNLRYSIQRSMLGKWRLWVAVDAEFDLRPNSDTATPLPESIRTGNKSDNRDLTPPSQIDQDPIIAAVLILLHKKLAATIEGGGHIGVGDEVGVELLFWDTVISLDLRISDGGMHTRTDWVGKIGEKRPSGSGWFIIPIPLFEIF